MSCTLCGGGYVVGGGSFGGGGGRVALKIGTNHRIVLPDFAQKVLQEGYRYRTSESYYYVVARSMPLNACFERSAR